MSRLWLLAGLSVIEGRVYRGKACIRPLPARLIKIALVAATALVVVALLVDYVVPILFDA